MPRDTGKAREWFAKAAGTGADTRDFLGETPLHTAAAIGYTKACKLLPEHGAQEEGVPHADDVSPAPGYAGGGFIFHGPGIRAASKQNLSESGVTNTDFHDKANND